MNILRSSRALVSQLAGVKQLGIRVMATAAAPGGSGEKKSFTNRLAKERSPYLLQHASNPVDWYPWGEEAFQKAKSENKPIFLSVGYSTCHWCHVMERESFENLAISEVMNENFVNVKVDREERPDVDSVYMTFVQATAGGGGWPMSVWLTPDLRPIIGGTYFPPDDRYYGRPGFKNVLLRIAKKWKDDRPSIEERGAAILDALASSAEVTSGSDDSLPGREAIHKCYQQLSRGYDVNMGGFSKAPKFPQPVNFNFLFRLWANGPESEAGKRALEMSCHTLKMMGKGGIHDHIAQGFHRYSTDDDWHVPHFEKMLYDQGQLAQSYLDAYQITKEEVFAALARDIFKYVTRDLSDKSGGFYSAEDADSVPPNASGDASAEKKEGAFCVWEYDVIQQTLAGNDVSSDVNPADVFCFHYDVRKGGNVDPYKDPHDELKNQNVLIERGDVSSTATKFGLTEDRVRGILSDARQKLYRVRETRPKPHLDNKMLTAWNGYMISGFARGGQVFGDPALTERATQAAQFVHDHAYNTETNTLYRCTYTTESGVVSQLENPIEGFVSDYAMLIRALMDLYEAGFEPKWLEWADKLQRRQDELFWDETGGAYYSSSGADSSILIRLKEDQDGAEPSPNSVSCLNLLRLAEFLDSDTYREKAVRMLMAFSARIGKIPIALPEMVCALMFLMSTPKQIIIVGDKNAADTQSLLRAVHSRFIPNKVVLCIDGATRVDGVLSHLQQHLVVGTDRTVGAANNEVKSGSSGQKKKTSANTTSVVDNVTNDDTKDADVNADVTNFNDVTKATAYVCENYACKLPVTTVEELEKLL